MVFNHLEWKIENDLICMYAYWVAEISSFERWSDKKVISEIFSATIQETALCDKVATKFCNKLRLNIKDNAENI